MLALGSIIVLLVGAPLIAALSVRARPAVLRLATQICCALSLGWLFAVQQLGASAALPWLASGDTTLRLEMASSDSLVLGSLLLVCGAVTAGPLAGSAKKAALGLLYAGLLVLLAGGLLAIAGRPPVASLFGLGLAWVGGATMQLVGSSTTQAFRLGGLPIVALATALLALGAAPQLAGEPIATFPWAAGCCVLIALGARWGTTPAAPVLLRAPIMALGLPALGAVLLLETATTQEFGPQTTLLLLLFGVAATVLGAWNAVTATRLSDTLAWQTTAQLGSIALVFGTGRPEAVPMANGLLAHALVTGTAAALVIGLLARAAGADTLADLTPPARPMVAAGLSYGLAAASAIGLPPLLGFSLRQVVVVLAQLSRPWLVPLVLAGSTLLALSYLPALAACLRRPALPTKAPRIGGASWPLLLMLGLVMGGLVPQTLWQRALGDPGAARAGMPPLIILLSGWLPTLLLLALLAAIVVWLRRGRTAAVFAGGDPLDAEPGWALPFTALRNTVRPRSLRRAGVPLRARGAWWYAWERRRYLAIAVAGLVVIVLLALQ